MLRISPKAPVAFALGAALVVGSVAPSFAFSGVHGASQGEAKAPIVQVRAGARYDKLQQEQAFETGYDDPRVWLGESDAPRNTSQTIDRDRYY